MKTSSRVARLAAYMIDVLVFIPILILLRYLRTPVLSIVVVYGYFWVTTALYGQSLGKKVFGLHVISEDGKKLDWGKAFIREVVGRFVSGIVFQLGFIWILFDGKRQGWHDKLANTVVTQDEELKGGKKAIAYILAFGGPVLVILLIVIGFVAALVFGTQVKKAREIQQQQYNQLPNYNYYK